jgi:hypothetical protein
VTEVRQLAGSVPGGKCLPALVQTACAICREVIFFDNVFLQVVFSDISLAQVVFFKNSCQGKQTHDRARDDVGHGAA